MQKRRLLPSQSGGNSSQGREDEIWIARTRTRATNGAIDPLFPSFADFMEVDQLPTRPPRVLEPREEGEAEIDDEDREEEEDRSGGDGRSRNRRKRQAPYIIFPEILCIVDYDGYRLVNRRGRPNAPKCSGFGVRRMVEDQDENS